MEHPLIFMLNPFADGNHIAGPAVLWINRGQYMVESARSVCRALQNIRHGRDLRCQRTEGVAQTGIGFMQSIPRRPKSVEVKTPGFDLSLR